MDGPLPLDHIVNASVVGDTRPDGAGENVLGATISNAWKNPRMS